MFDDLQVFGKLLALGSSFSKERCFRMDIGFVGGGKNFWIQNIFAQGGNDEAFKIGFGNAFCFAGLRMMANSGRVSTTCSLRWRHLRLNPRRVP